MWTLVIMFSLIWIQEEASLPAQPPLLEISFCRPEVPEAIRRGRADFNAIYSFAAAEDHQPVDVQKVLDPYVGQEKIRPCIEEWRLPGMRVGSEVTVALYWKHGVGWTSMSISGEHISQKITLAGESCPYGKDSAK